MTSFAIHCPGCNVALKVSSATLGKKGRCRSCGANFPIRPEAHGLAATPQPDLIALGDTVAGWLAVAREDEEIAAPGSSISRPLVCSTTISAPPLTSRARLAPSHASPARFGPRPPVRPCRAATSYPVRLEQVDTAGATLTFSSRLLYDDSFRALLPQQCAQCGLKQGLLVRVVTWGGAYQPAAAPLPVPLKLLGGISGRALLKKLQPLRELPEPYSLPMPYYLCAACEHTDAGLSACVVREGYEECRLRIKSLACAETFLAAARGMECEDIFRIRRLRVDQDPWLLLPADVRIRLSHWYRPRKGERFRAFIADQETAPHEGGHAGIVLTDRRMVCHKGMRDIEVPLGEGEALSLSSELHEDSDNIRLQITSDTGQQAWFLIPPAGLRQLQDSV